MKEQQASYSMAKVDRSLQKSEIRSVFNVDKVKKDWTSNNG